jgi:hypothetical protein
MNPCVLLASIILSPNPMLPAWDDVLVTQPYPGWYSAGLSCESGPGYMLAEDCYPTFDFIPYQIDLWLGFNPPGSVGEYNFGFQLDESGAPGGMFFWYGTENDVIYEEIGLSMWGLDFFHVIVTISEPPVLPAGQPCWFCFQAVSSSTVGCLVQNNIPSWNSQCFFSMDNGESWQSSQSTWGTSYGVFMIISGTTGLNRSTWGSIKGCFI